MADPLVGGDEALAECVGGHLDVAGPVTVEQLVATSRCPPARCAAPRSPRPGPAPDWPGWRRPARPSSCPTAAGAHATCWSACTRPAGARRRRHVEPASMADFVRFLACWQHVAAGTQAEGRAGLLAVDRAAPGPRGGGR